MTESSAREQRLYARLAGALYVLVVAGGVFAEIGVRGALVVDGDPVATSTAIVANEGLWRLGIAINLAYLVAAVLLTVLIFKLLQPVQTAAAASAAALALVSVTIEVAGLLFLTLPLLLSPQETAIPGLGEGAPEALGYLGIRLQARGFALALFLFAGVCILNGLLIAGSRLIPRLIGVLMVVAGLCYATNSLAVILSPPTAAALFPWVLLPCFVAESSLALWLLLAGVKPISPPDTAS